MRRVVVTGLGIVSPLGNDLASSWEGITHGRSGIGPLTHVADAYLDRFTTKIAGEVRDFDITADNEQFGNHTTGSLGWGMELGGGFRLNASYGTAFKAPTFSDLYDPWSGVATLDPEKARSSNIGIAQQGQGWRWGLDVYETRVDDLITYDAATFRMTQVEKARIRGAELTAATTLAARSALFASWCSGGSRW